MVQASAVLCYSSLMTKGHDDRRQFRKETGDKFAGLLYLKLLGRSNLLTVPSAPSKGRNV